MSRWKKPLIVTFLLSLISLYLDAQVYGGTITDTNGSPIHGAHILIGNTNQGTISNVDGQYKLTVNDANQPLLITHIGYQPVTISP